MDKNNPYEQPNNKENISQKTEPIQITSGDITLILREPLQTEIQGDQLYVPDFDILVPKDSKPEEINQSIVKKYREYDRNAATSQLSGKKLELWKRICNIVDRLSTFELSESKVFVRTLGQIIKVNPREMTVRWSDGHEVPIKTELFGNFKNLGQETWFEADVRQDKNGILELKEIEVIPDYQPPTDDEIYSFFGKNKK